MTQCVQQESSRFQHGRRATDAQSSVGARRFHATSRACGNRNVQAGWQDARDREQAWNGRCRHRRERRDRGSEIGEDLRALPGEAQTFKLFQTDATSARYFYSFKTGVIFLAEGDGDSQPYLGFVWESGEPVSFEKLVPFLEDVKGMVCCDPAGARVWLHDAGMELSKLEALTNKVVGYWPNRTTVAVLPSTYEVYIGPSIAGLDNTLPP